MFYRNKIGNEICSKECFITEYSKNYFIDSAENVDKDFKVKNISKSSRFVENEICEFLSTEKVISDPHDVFNILAWKIGTINHRSSIDRFVYHSNCDYENYIIKDRKNEIKIKDLAEHILEKNSELTSTAKNRPQDFLNNLNDFLDKNGIKGIGTVYLITLLFFMSKGKYPIYDQFAAKAVYAIKNNIAPNNAINYSFYLPGRDSAWFSKIMCWYMNDYINDLKSIFGEEYKTNRDIDRALWVYGHAF